MKSILFAFLLIIVPIVGNAIPVDESTCTSLETEDACNGTLGCSWVPVPTTGGICRQCSSGSYGEKCQSQCPTGYVSEAGSTAKSDCYMTCDDKSVEHGSWVSDTDKVYWPENKQQCKYTQVAQLTCVDGYHKEAISQTEAECISNIMPCQGFIARYCAGKLTNGNTEYDTKNFTDMYCKIRDIRLGLHDTKSVGNAIYNNTLFKWDVTGCTGLQITNPVNSSTYSVYPCAFTTVEMGQGYWAMTEYVTAIDSGTGRNVCNAVHVATNTTPNEETLWMDTAISGYYYGLDVGSRGLFSPCPMGTTSDIGGTADQGITVCHTTEKTVFVDSAENKFSVADLFDTNIQLSVTTNNRTSIQ